MASPALDDRLYARAQPISSSRDQLLPLIRPLATLFPGEGLQRGTVVAIRSASLTGSVGSRPVGSRPVGSGGATTLAFALMVEASITGSWCAVVGDGDIGVLSLAEIGVDVARVAIVPHPGSSWAEVVAVLVDGMDAVVVRLPGSARMGVTRRLVARVRDRRAVLIILSEQGRWTEAPDVQLVVHSSIWHGIGTGHGHLQGRCVEVVATGRRRATKPVHTELWLPGPTGSVTGSASTGAS